MNNKLEFSKNRLSTLLNSYALKNPLALYEIKTQKLDILIDNLELAINRILEMKSTRYVSLLDKMEALNPVRTIKRGYTITRFNNKTIKSINDIKKGNIITTELVDGILTSQIMEVKNEK